MNAYIILGDDDTGKSTTIRHLTGRARSGVTILEMADGKIREVYVQLCSLPEEEILAKTFIESVNETEAVCVVVALWVRPRPSQPLLTVESYLEAFEAEGWSIKHIEGLWTGLPEVLRPWRRVFKSVRVEGPNGRWLPSNRIAQEIRKRWGWL